MDKFLQLEIYGTFICCLSSTLRYKLKGDQGSKGVCKIIMDKKRVKGGFEYINFKDN